MTTNGHTSHPGGPYVAALAAGDIQDSSIVRAGPGLTTDTNGEDRR